MQERFNLLYAATVWKQSWRTIALFTLLAGAMAAITVFLAPQYYRGTVRVVSANPVLADKARLFNTQIQSLYSYFGSGDDLDRIQGIASMDTTFRKLVNEFGLIAYYHSGDTGNPKKKISALKKLRKDIRFQRTEEGQLLITAWMKEPGLAAAVANRIVSIVTDAEEAIWQQNYQHSLNQLRQNIQAMETSYKQLSDSLSILNGSEKELATLRLQTILEQLKQYRKVADEFALAEQSRPPVLYVLEPAVPALQPEKPEKLNIIIAACILGFVFSSLVLLFRNRKTEG